MAESTPIPWVVERSGKTAVYSASYSLGKAPDLHLVPVEVLSGSESDPSPVASQRLRSRAIEELMSQQFSTHRNSHAGHLGARGHHRWKESILDYIVFLVGTQCCSLKTTAKALTKNTVPAKVQEFFKGSEQAISEIVFCKISPIQSPEAAINDPVA
jgi:hypothetical protein